MNFRGKKSRFFAGRCHPSEKQPLLGEEITFRRGDELDFEGKKPKKRNFFDGREGSRPAHKEPGRIPAPSAGGTTQQKGKLKEKKTKKKLHPHVCDSSERGQARPPRPLSRFSPPHFWFLGSHNSAGWARSVPNATAVSPAQPGRARTQ